jgi:hypothetical protein
MFRSLIIISSILVLSLWADAHQEHRHHGAHVHGKGSMSIAFDDAKGEIVFHTAAMGIVGFEHDAHSKKDIQAKADAFKKFENEIMNMAHFDANLNCKYEKKSMEMKKDEDGDHSDFDADFEVTCDKSPIGTTIVFNFSMWPAMHEVAATILAGTLQKTVEVKDKSVSLVLK